MNKTFTLVATNTTGSTQASTSVVVADAPPIATTVLWDGASGVTPDYFNIGALLPWQNRLGDWADAQGVAQGPAAFTVGNRVGLGSISIIATTLVTWLHANPGHGIFLKSSGNGWVATKLHADPTKRPALVVIDALGAAIVCQCLSCAVIKPSSAYAQTGPEFSLGSSGESLLLEFDLATVTNWPIVSAMLTITVTAAFSPGLTLQAYATRNAKILNSGMPATGLAAGYAKDLGIMAHPDVYFASLFDPVSTRDYFPGTKMYPDATYAMDAELGVPALGIKYHPGEFAPFIANQLHSWSQKAETTSLQTNPINGLVLREPTPQAQYRAQGHPHTPSELYFRYYLKLQQGYQCSTDGKKLPGLSGRYGKWDGNSYNPVDGNGGSPTTGLYYPNYPGIGAYFSGWSMRHLAYHAPTDANPYGSLVPLNYYAYHASMVGPFGDRWRWGNATDGYPNLAPDRWYCIEHHVKMNDVIAPFDADGNGVGVANGVVRGWVDGVQVFNKTNAVLRKHPAIKIDEVWFNHYHGGTKPAEAEHPLRMAACVVAKSYIGPMRLN